METTNKMKKQPTEWKKIIANPIPQNNSTAKQKICDLKMSLGSEQTFSQRRHSDGQQVYENVFNIRNCQGNTYQNHSELSPHTCQNGYIQKTRNKKCVQGCIVKGTLVLLVGMYIGAATMENSMEVPQKVEKRTIT